MNKKHDLFEELNIDKKESDFFGPVYIDVQTVKQNVNSKLDSAYTERKSYFMKSTKKVSLIAAAAAMVLGASVFAASGIVSNWFSSSSSVPNYTSLPTAQQVTEDIGYEPILINSFSNGYTFKNGSIVNNNLTDENNNSVEKFKSVSFDYEKGGDIVIFSQDKFSSEKYTVGEIVKTVGDTDIYYHCYTNKILPPKYQLTEDDKKAEQRGELVFSYGSQEIKVSKVQSVTWTEDDMQYQLLQIDGKLSPEELASMAEEIISL